MTFLLQSLALVADRKSAQHLRAIVISSTVGITREEALRPKAMPDRLPAHPSPDLPGARRNFKEGKRILQKIKAVSSIVGRIRRRRGSKRERWQRLAIVLT
jgi:hypothetical protein